MKKHIGICLILLAVVALVASLFGDSYRIRESLRVEGVSLLSSRQEIIDSGWQISESSKEESDEPIFVRGDSSLGVVFENNKATMLQGYVLLVDGNPLKAGDIRGQVFEQLGEPARQTKSRVDDSPIDSFEYSNFLGLPVASLQISYNDNVIRGFSLRCK